VLAPLAQQLADRPLEWECGRHTILPMQALRVQPTRFQRRRVDRAGKGF
jgi:hypothetical protein